MENKLLDKIANSFNTDLPEADSMDEYLDKIIPVVRRWSEDLREENFYVGNHWIELRDDDSFHELVLHIFNPEQEYIKSVNGKMINGEWRHLGNKLLITHDEGEVYELAFMDPEFFILKKHSNPNVMDRRYFVLVKESIARKLEWREALELLFNKYKNNNSFYLTLAVIVLLIIAIIMVLS
ncbi:MAG: hypothetical protein DHS20C18_33070 [Saprospiraceae bacterium]|nr:MAG: hypothetical protein DHS20C18_33070 [Saprospiraceae bacterium]